MMQASKPLMRGSFKEQDTSDTTEEMAVRARPPRSILKALVVRSVAPSEVCEVIVCKHYLHAMPAAPVCCFGVYLDARLVGAVVFTMGPRNGYRVLEAARPVDVIVLARLWLRDDLPDNSETRVLGIVLRQLRRASSYKLVLSYADPAAGHLGTIYQASGWQYLGQSPVGRYLRLADGRVLHPRGAFHAFGSNQIQHLRATGVAVERERVAGKHRYAYLLDPAWHWRLRAPEQPYPKGGRSPPT